MFENKFDGHYEPVAQIGKRIHNEHRYKVLAQCSKVLNSTENRRGKQTV